MVLGGSQKPDGENEEVGHNHMAPSSGPFAVGGEGRNGGHSLDEHMMGAPYSWQREEQGLGSSSVPSETEQRWSAFFARKMEWGKCKEWMKNPRNMALSMWVVAVGVAGAILFMVVTGMLNRALPRKAQRDTWLEVSNQVLNALFTLMCLYQHPRRCYHLALLCRWRAGDVLQLRQAYCKDGTCKPGERKHITVVILLLHLNCLAQYALCGLNLGYPRQRRPPLGVGLTVSVAICSPAVAGLYSNLSPLGKAYEEAHEQQPDPERRYSFAGAAEPRWAGGLLDLWDDISLVYLSLFCSCCVFGWNMSRLGFGNMYVHVVTLLLFCLAPFFVFNLAAINIDNEAVRDALGLGGVLLCALGLLYGGFWRIQMRRRFNLPANTSCCGKPDLTDCFHWLCCYSCALAQEVRTADAYQVQVVQDSNANLQPHPMDMDDLSMHQPLRFAGVFAPGLRVSDADANTDTLPPAVSVIHIQ